MHSRLSICLAILLLLVACKKNTGTSSQEPGSRTAFLHTQGKQIIDSNGNPILLKGVAFGNEVWSDNEVPATHHNEADFIRVKNMNMNVIRFYLNYKSFESDASPYQYKSAGWNWINQNIAWARKHGIYLILNMHAPQGGYQSQGKGDALWTNNENQKRLCSLWAAIASQYKDEKQIAGFGPVNEPVPTSSMAQWTDLASRLRASIRQQDTNHIIFMEKAIYVKGAPEDANLNFPMVQDNNIAYEFHMYDPYFFTHQQFSWSGLGDGGKYPDETIIAFTNASWYTATFNNPSLLAGNQDWIYMEGVKYSITDPKIKLAAPALVATSVGGKVYYDDILIKEFDPAGNFTRDVFRSSLDSANGWYYWSANGTGQSGTASIGKSNNKSIFIEQSTGDCNVTLSEATFAPKQNYSYQISGWMKGENVAASAGVKLRIDFSSTTDPIYGRNKAYLEAVLKRFSQWAASRNVPLYMGEFGTGTPTFSNNKGGLTWVGDVISIAKSNGIHFSYHAYHEDSFGLYYGYGTLPDPANANQSLINLITDALK